MHILIFGASGHAGAGLAQQLSSDHRLTGVVRRPPPAPTGFHPLVAPGWVDDPSSVLAVLDAEDCPPVDAVIAALGGWYVDSPILDRGLGSLDDDYDSYLRSHFTAAAVSERLAAMRPPDEADADGQTRTDDASGGQGRLCHLALNGVASVEALAGSGAISVFGAAQNMLIRVADAEVQTVDFRELRIMAPIGGDDRNDLSGGVVTISIAEVARAVESVLAAAGRFAISTEIGSTG